MSNNDGVEAVIQSSHTSETIILLLQFRFDSALRYFNNLEIAGYPVIGK